MTNAHLDVARRAAALFDRLVIAVLHNPKKAPLFTVDERVGLIEACVADLGDHVAHQVEGERRRERHAARQADHLGTGGDGEQRPRRHVLTRGHRPAREKSRQLAKLGDDMAQVIGGQTGASDETNAA